MFISRARWSPAIFCSILMHAAECVVLMALQGGNYVQSPSPSPSYDSKGLPASDPQYILQIETIVYFHKKNTACYAMPRHAMARNARKVKSNASHCYASPSPTPRSVSVM